MEKKLTIIEIEGNIEFKSEGFTKAEIIGHLTLYLEMIKNDAVRESTLLRKAKKKSTK